MLKRIIILAIIFIISYICGFTDNQNWRDFKFKEVGITFKLPYDINTKVYLDGKTFYENNKSSDLEIEVIIEDINSMFEDFNPTGYYKELALNMKESLSKGETVYGPKFYWEEKIVKLDSIYVQTSVILKGFDAYPDLKRCLLFFHYNYLIEITVDASESKNDIVKSMPSYFTATGEWDFENKNCVNDFFTKLKDGTASAKALKWYNFLDEIIKAISIDNRKCFYTTVDNLRLRDKPSLDANNIRYLKKGEKLFCIDKTSEVSNIDNISDYWYKVETLSGEIGWCFGGYIKEID